MNDKIFVVTHKKLDWKLNKKNYSYIQVNFKTNNDLGFEYNDALGNNISEKNGNYCELTALYWIWKNYKCKDNDIVGLCHYRRFFSFNKYFKFLILNMYQIKKILKNIDIILPKKFKFPMSTYDYYFKKGAGKEKDLKKLRSIIKKRCPEYLKAFDSFFNKKEGWYCNMMICRKELFDNYCEWLFDILFELEKEVDLKNYSVSEARIYGYLSELLLNVYVIQNNLLFKEMDILNTESLFFYKLKNKIKNIK